MRLIAAIIGRAHRSATHLHAGKFPLSLGVAAFLYPAIAFAAGPEGDWWVHDKQARIRIADCAGALWGVISWEAKPGVDEHNPDPAKRGRPMLGVPIILGMKPAGADKWSGSIYNSAFGQTVKGGISLEAPETLRITGCVLGLLCGGENWTRAEADPAGESSQADAPEAVCKSASAGQ